MGKLCSARIGLRIVTQPIRLALIGFVGHVRDECFSRDMASGLLL